MMDARHAVPIDRSSPVAAVRLLWHAMHSDDGANMPCTSGASLGPLAATVTAPTENSASSQTTAAGRSHLLPAIKESPLVPVPQEVREHLRVTILPLVHRDLYAAADQDVTTLAQRHLHLRHDVPFGFRVADQLSRRDQLDDRRPRPVVAALDELLAECRAPERFARNDVGFGGQSDARVKLHEAEGGETLPVRRKRFERGDAAAEADRLLPRRQSHFLTDAEDAAVRDAVEQVALDGNRDVAQAVVPRPTLGLLRLEGDVELHHRPGAEPALVQERVAHGARRASAKRRRDQRLV